MLLTSFTEPQKNLILRALNGRVLQNIYQPEYLEGIRNIANSNRIEVQDTTYITGLVSDMAYPFDSKTGHQKLTFEGRMKASKELTAFLKKYGQYCYDCKTEGSYQGSFCVKCQNKINGESYRSVETLKHSVEQPF